MPTLSPLTPESARPFHFSSSGCSIPYARCHAVSHLRTNLSFAFAPRTNPSPCSFSMPPSPLTLFSQRRLVRTATSPRGTPESGPPPNKDSVGIGSIAASLSRLQNTVQIFFAVLFWMSLFFWASAWDGRNRPGKRSRR